MAGLSNRRDFLAGSALSSAAVLGGAKALTARSLEDDISDASGEDVHEQLLSVAARMERDRRAKFAAIRSKAELDTLQATLRAAFLESIGGLPDRVGPPTVRKTGEIREQEYVIEKLLYESFPGYFVSALLYKPTTLNGRAPGILSPCGHSENGKAYKEYQALHANLARRGYVVLTYDPVGQGERSQFWDVKRNRSRFNLSCGEHAVLGNALSLLGTNLARYRVWDGMRGIDLLQTVPEVDPARIGCVGNSGGGTLTSYISALDPRVAVAVIGCYITTLPRRMENRIQEDPSADPEQDPYDFVAKGIDHAGLLAMIAPRPTLLCAATLDFFPIEGTRETFAEAKRLYEVAGAGDRIAKTETIARHGMSEPLRAAAYAWFDRWLMGRADAAQAKPEAVIPSRPDKELQVTSDGQVNLTLGSRPMLPMVLEQHAAGGQAARRPLKELLRLDYGASFYRIETLARGKSNTIVVLLNGNETPGWPTEKAFMKSLEELPYGIEVVDPRGVGTLRTKLALPGRQYTNPISGVEENIAYNAFLVGKSLVGMRVTDTFMAIQRIKVRHPTAKIVLCARADAAIVATLAAAIDPGVNALAVESLRVRFRDLFDVDGQAINAASILPGMLSEFGDMTDVLGSLGDRKTLVAAPVGKIGSPTKGTFLVPDPFSSRPSLFTEWLRL